MGFLARLFGKKDSSTAASAEVDSRWASQEPIRVTDIPEEYEWMKAHPCECGGAWSPGIQSVGKWPGAPEHMKYDLIEASCERCARRLNFHFLVDTHSPQYLAGQEAAMKELLGDDPEGFFGSEDEPSRPSSSRPSNPGRKN
jgi:hypothetical protein